MRNDLSTVNVACKPSARPPPPNTMVAPQYPWESPGAFYFRLCCLVAPWKGGHITAVCSNSRLFVACYDGGDVCVFCSWRCLPPTSRGSTDVVRGLVAPGRFGFVKRSPSLSLRMPQGNVSHVSVAREISISSVAMLSMQVNFI